MAIAGIPQNLLVQQGNSQVFLSWDLVAGAITYQVQRSTDGVSFTNLATPAINNYLDTAVTSGTNYFYQVASVNGSGTSSYTIADSIVPTPSGEISLGQVRLMAQQRADLVNSGFITTPEWNTYINQSYFELYDLLVTLYEDYFVQAPSQFTTDGSTSQYDLGTIAPNFYKLLGVDIGLNLSNNAWVTLKKFDFISRNRYVYPNISSTFLGVFNLRYRVVGNTLMFIPTPSGNQIVRVWYIPRLTQLLKDTDIMDGISGWTEYVIIDAAIKAMQKEESDTSVLMMQKQALMKRIEESASNRDAGQPDTISNIRTNGERWGGYGYDGASGGN